MVKGASVMVSAPASPVDLIRIVASTTQQRVVAFETAQQVACIVSTELPRRCPSLPAPRRQCRYRRQLACKVLGAFRKARIAVPHRNTKQVSGPPPISTSAPRHPGNVVVVAAVQDVVVGAAVEHVLPLLPDRYRPLHSR